MDNEELTLRVICVAVPVTDDSGAIVAEISTPVPPVRATSQFKRQAVQVLVEQTSALSRLLGGPQARPQSAMAHDFEEARRPELVPSNQPSTYNKAR